MAKLIHLVFLIGLIGFSVPQIVACGDDSKDKDDDDGKSSKAPSIRSICESWVPIVADSIGEEGNIGLVKECERQMRETKDQLDGDDWEDYAGCLSKAKSIEEIEECAMVAAMAMMTNDQALEEYASRLRGHMKGGDVSPRSLCKAAVEKDFQSDEGVCKAELEEMVENIEDECDDGKRLAEFTLSEMEECTAQEDDHGDWKECTKEVLEDMVTDCEEDKGSSEDVRLMLPILDDDKDEDEDEDEDEEGDEDDADPKDSVSVENVCAKFMERADEDEDWAEWAEEKDAEEGSCEDSIGEAAEGWDKEFPQFEGQFLGAFDRCLDENEAVEDFQSCMDTEIGFILLDKDDDDDDDDDAGKSGPPDEVCAHIIAGMEGDGEEIPDGLEESCVMGMTAMKKVMGNDLWEEFSSCALKAGSGGDFKDCEEAAEKAMEKTAE